jgi:photosystem II stability/assembly factor-like uncharacterized protein
MVTSDGGQTWTSALHDEMGWINAAWLPDGRLLTVETRGEVRVSDDLGRTWTRTADLVPADDPLPVRVSGIAVTPAGRMYALVNGGGLLASEDAATWTKETSPFDPLYVGFGEVAAIDDERAVAGGPAPLSTRTTALPRPVARLALAREHGSVTVTDGPRITTVTAETRVTTRLAVRR